MPSATKTDFVGRCIVVVPCLNEAEHIRALLEKLGAEARRFDLKIIVADGGSSDGTQQIVAEIMQNDPRVILLHNEKRIQSAAINLAVASYGDGHDYLIRIDAHGKYPDDYCEKLLNEAAATGADSVVVGMATEGFGTFQKATALAQNSKLGNGGARHRHGAKGHWTDHGHHALMRVSMFRQVGGYDEGFTHNEDAELDCRLKAAGARIWMTDKTFMVYYPRSSASALFKQYLGYGRGRAKNLLKHRMIPKVRQALALDGPSCRRRRFSRCPQLVGGGTGRTMDDNLHGLWRVVGRWRTQSLRSAGVRISDDHASRLVHWFLAATVRFAQTGGYALMTGSINQSSAR